MTWSTVTEYRCIKWPRICSVWRNHNPGHVLIHVLSPGLLCASTWVHNDIFRLLCFYPSRYAVFCCPFRVFVIFLCTFRNILREKYSCSTAIWKKTKNIRRIIHQYYKNCINVCPSVWAGSIWKSLNQNLIKEIF